MAIMVIILKYMEISNHCIVHQKQTQYCRSFYFKTNETNKLLERDQICGLPEANGFGRGIG